MIQIILPLICLLYGSAMFRDEMEDRSLTYLFICPMDRTILLLGKYFATIILLIPLAIIGVALTVVAFLFPYGGETLSNNMVTITQFSVAASLGVMAYAAVFTLLGLLLKRAMIAGICYIIFFEILLSKISQLAVYKATIFYQLTNMIQVESLVFLGDRLSKDLKGFWNTSTPSAAQNTLFIMIAVFLAISAYFLRTQEWESKPRE